MLGFTLGSLALLAVSAAAQSLPSCANDCVTNYNGCNQLDVACICKSSDWIAGLACCVAKNCNAADQDETIKFANKICAGAGVTNLPQTATCASGASSAAASSAAATGVAPPITSAPASSPASATAVASSAASASVSAKGPDSSLNPSAAASASASSAAASASASDKTAGVGAAASSQSSATRAPTGAANANKAAGVGVGALLAGLAVAL